MNRIDTMRAAVEARQSEIDDLLARIDTGEAAEDDVARADSLLTEQETEVAEMKRLVELAKRAEAVKDVPLSPQFLRRVEPTETPTEVRDLSRSQARSQALKVIERDADRQGLDSRNMDRLDRLTGINTPGFSGDYIARRLLITESDDYRSAFVKRTMFGQEAGLTPDESRALNALMQLDYELRAASNTDAAGGYGVPILIDPTVIITSGAADVPVLRIARVVTITNDSWKGVSSAGVSWSWDGEAGTVSDDAATLAQPEVVAHKAQGFIPYSIEIGMDYPSFAEEMRRLLDQGYTSLLAGATVTGSGSSQPYGIFTAIDATAASEVTSTTDGAFGGEDIFAVWNALPERYRSRASWVMDVTHESKIRQFGTGTNAMAYFTLDLTGAGISQINGRPVYLTDYAPSYSSTTGAANRLIVGDFSNYLVAQRAGMNLELVPHLFDVTYNRPTGQRGWFAWARVGADSVNDNGFRLLQNA